MPRVFSCLALSLLLVLVGVAGLGWLAPGNSAQRHVALAVFALLLSCFIQVLTFTYLTVTGKVIAQMAHLGRLDGAFVGSSKRIKKRFSRLLAAVVTSIVLATATGAARWSGPAEGSWHLLAAMTALAGHFLGMAAQYAVVVENAALVADVANAYAQKKAVPAAHAGPTSPFAR